jgi:hypothetical protein
MERIFGIIPASSGPMWVLLGIGIVLIAVIGFLGFIAYSSKNVRFEVGDDGLRISRSIYGRFIPWQEIAGDGVRIVDLNTDAEYKPKRRTNGAGLPGYWEGWFKLQNDEKALLFVTDRSSVVYIPTTDNYSVLLSVREADEFAELVRSRE